MEEQNLVKIHSAGNLVNAELIVGLLKEHDIDAHILNKKDSMYFIGDVEIYVDSKDAEAAKTIIANRPE